MRYDVAAPALPRFWEWRVSNGFDNPESPTGRNYTLTAFNTRTNYVEEESFFLALDATKHDVQIQFEGNAKRVANRAWNNHADTAEAEELKVEWEEAFLPES